MLTGLSALENTNWSKLHHAYCRATDTPGHLNNLIQDDNELRSKAIGHLRELYAKLVEIQNES